MSHDFSPPPTQQSTGTNFFTKRRFLGTSSFLSSMLRSRHCGQAEPLSTDACEAPLGLGSPGHSQLSSAGSGVRVREQSLEFHLKMWLGQEGVAGVAPQRHPLPGQGGCNLSLWIEALVWTLPPGMVLIFIQRCFNANYIVSSLGNAARYLLPTSLR